MSEIHNESFHAEEKKSSRIFHFTDETDLIEVSCSSSDEDDQNVGSVSECHKCGHQCLNVTIFEVLNPNYGMYVWPCAPILAQYIWYNREVIRGKTVLELGAGTALPSVVAAKCGANVIISDAENLSEILQIAKKNMEYNKVPSSIYDIIGMSWGVFSPSFLEVKPVDIILGSDLFYEPEEFEDVVMSVAYLLEKNAEAEFWCSYQERSSDWNIDRFILKWNLDCKEVPLDEFGVRNSSYSFWKIPKFQKLCLYVMKLKCHSS